MKKVIVAGGSGFIGSHLCDYLISLGYFVLCVDNNISSSRENISHLVEHSNFKFINHDIILPLDLEDIDEIYNLASLASPAHYLDKELFTIKTNLIGSINLLDLALKNNAKILLASTSEIYGSAQVHPQSEYYRGNVNPVGKRSCYSESKRCAETLFASYCREMGVNARIARLFNTYGPRMSSCDGRVVPNFVLSAIKGRELKINGDGSQTRSFCYISDLVSGLFLLMNSSNTGVDPVNIGNPVEITVEQLAKKIIKMTRSSSVIHFSEELEDDPRRRRPDITKARNTLGWDPKVDLNQGLTATINYFSELESVPFTLL